MAPEPEPEGSGGGVSDAPESWGMGGLVGDGRYRLTHRLGRGGMAEVFAAEDVRLGRTVAVKLLRSDLAEDPTSKARFTREAQSVAGLNHHAVVAVYDSGEDQVGGSVVPYIVMELVEGRTIRELLQNAEAPGPEQALIIVSGVLEALAYSHQHGIVHRDIKPANVIITHSGAVKVMDFGIARALHGAQSTMTQTGMVMGTPQYLSPEQALGKAVDHRSDLYATGCLLYELLAQRPPFTGETPLSVVYQHVQDIPVPPSEISDVAPPELDGLVMRSLAKDPDDRFQSAEEMRGLIQYGLSMLQEQGSHTGVWNTGPVELHEGGHTPAGGGTYATTAMGHPHHGDTSQMRAGGAMLPPMNPDDGGYDGGHGGNRGGRGKMWMFAVLAIIAITAGVAFAMNRAADNGTEEKKDPPKVSESPTESEKKPSKSPTDDGGESSPDTDPGTSSTGGQQPSWTPTDIPSTPPSSTPSNTPSDPPSSPTQTAPGTSTDGGTDDGGTDVGGTDDGGTSDGGTNGDPGTDPGGTDAGGTDAGGTGAGGTDAGGTDAGGTNAGATTP
ncbi:serine/threonine protein kinase [Streptomyces sp. ISL-99]|uniref:protein kinase domain-containing protein n=1 Tax=Streptomyces sp. ISL-99 TaxID=2819193 RepID=UPI001BEB0DD3|nr:protein kinase [Streptomyces sp. ISL-99]MBT2524304.1 serine/threonine protein kinase [Streptomyces sp. ISL-99]